MIIATYRLNGEAMNSIVVTYNNGQVAPHAGLSESARAFAAASLAENTRRAYAAQWRLWTAHCQANGLTALPADTTAVANWIAQRATEGDVGGKRRKAGARGQAIATLRTALAAIGAAHQANGIVLDTGAAELRMVLKGIRREKTEKIAKAAPLRAGLLMEVIAALGDTPLEVRDAALLSLGYAFARRRSELAGLDLDRLGDGDGVLSSDAHALTVTLIRHKTQAGEPLVSTVPRDGSETAVKAIERWVALAAVKSGEPVLRRVLKGGKITTERLHPQSVTGIIQRRVAEHFMRKGVPAAVAQREAELYSGHSLRHGFCTTAAEAGASVQAIMSVTGHKSVPIVMGYTAAADRARISPHRIKGVGLTSAAKL
ncbi:tyrosine-type recombinase/integrase [Hyphomicrobium zavarzinii]|uniref:tyrosine-type recombinase/integrase n=1 Tax=Hyphomicrobium zavarzinii TaxID=48292 RepID=UPI00039F938F|nr:tyrosine-type recombinase/integrase [Hyphomicrobium zavarzinii]